MTDPKTELERRVISGCLQDTSFLSSLKHWLFSDSTRSELVQIITSLHRKGEPLASEYVALEAGNYDVDLETLLLDEWKAIKKTNPPSDIESLLSGLINNNLSTIIDRITSDFERAKINPNITIHDLIQLIEKADSSLFEILPKKIITSINDDIEKAGKSFFNSKGDLLPTGISKLDDHLGGGLKKAEITTIAARPGDFKTGLGIQLAKNLAMNGSKCIVFSLEMQKETLLHFIISSISGVTQSRAYNQECKRRVESAIETLKKISDKLIIHDDIFVMAEAINITERQKPDVIIVDFIQMFRFSSEEAMRFDIMRLMKAFKMLAKRTNIPVVLLSQLSRGPEQRANRKPKLSDLAESSSIEWFSADILALQYPANTDVGADGFSNRNVLKIFALKKRYSGMFVCELFVVPETKNLFSDAQSMLVWREQCPQTMKISARELLDQN